MRIVKMVQAHAEGGLARILGMFSSRSNDAHPNLCFEEVENHLRIKYGELKSMVN
jgi:hypothetical protein